MTLFNFLTKILICWRKNKKVGIISIMENIISRKNIVGYYILTFFTFAFFVIIFVTKIWDFLFYYWIFQIWWPAKTVEILLKKNGYYSRNKEAWLGVAFVIVFFIISNYLFSLGGFKGF